MIFKNEKVYDALKWIALVFLPACNVLFLTLARAWGFSVNVEAISITICAVSTFIGALIGISGIKYQALVNTDIPENILAELVEDADAINDSEAEAETEPVTDIEG